MLASVLDSCRIDGGSNPEMSLSRMDDGSSLRRMPEVTTRLR